MSFKVDDDDAWSGGVVPVLFAWNEYSLPGARPADCVTTHRPEGEPTGEMDVGLLLRCHDDHAKPEAHQLEIEKLRERLNEVTLEQSFGLERFLASDDDIRFYTRFDSYRHLQDFWGQIEPATSRMVRADPAGRQSRCLPQIDELFLFLVFLSLGLTEKDLGDRFNILQCAVSGIIKAWAHFLYRLLAVVGIWMSPDTIRTTMPSVFGKYSDSQVLIDHTELRCQMPSSVLVQSKMVSQYKSHTTLKGRIGVSPNGAVTFVSSLYSGSVSDKDLFRQSGIVPLLDKDMAVMVDKGFGIDTLVPFKVYRLPFQSQTSQLSRHEVPLTRDIVRLKMHVERTTKSIRGNKLFDAIIPLTMAGSINQLFAVACLLTNYQKQPLDKAWCP